MKNYLKLFIQSKKYGNTTIFDNETLCLPSNELFYLCGQNGCGKTTLLNILSGLDEDYLGELSIDGHIINKSNLISYKDNIVTYVPQLPLVIEEYSVLDNIKFAFPNFDKEKALYVLEKVGLKDLALQSASCLSTGEKQRLCLARSFYEDKPILLLDEITSNLDEENKNKITQYLIEYAKTHLVIFSTHEEIKESQNIIKIIDHHIIVPQVKDFVYKPKETRIEKYNFFSEVKYFFKTEKLFCILSALFIFCLQFTFSSFSYFKKYSEENWAYQLENKIADKTYPAILTREEDINPSNAILGKYENPHRVFMMYLPINEERIDNDILGNIYSLCVEITSQDKQELKLLKGRFPENDKEFIVSDICFDNLLKEKQSQLNYDNALSDVTISTIKSSSGSARIVGIYQSRDASMLKEKLDNIPIYEDDKHDMHFYERILLSYQIETAYGYYSRSMTAMLFMPNTYHNRVSASTNRIVASLGIPYRGALVSIVDKKDHISPKATFFEKLYSASKPILISTSVLLLLLLISFFFTNHNRYPIRMLLGEKQKRLQLFPAITILVINLFSYLSATILSLLVCLIHYLVLGSKYDFLFGFFNKEMTLGFLLGLGIVACFSLLLYWLLKYVILNRNNHILKIVKEK